MSFSTEDKLRLVAVALVPSAGAEFLVSREREFEPRLLLAWPFCFPLDSLSKSQHRLLLAPEYLPLSGDVRGRLAYRFVSHPLFFGGGVAYGRELSLAASVDFGWRFYSFGSDDPNSANLFLVARGDTPVSREFGTTWASSLSVGFAFY